MKKTLACAISALALLLTSAASMGCIIFLTEEPEALKSFND